MSIFPYSSLRTLRRSIARGALVKTLVNSPITWSVSFLVAAYTTMVREKSPRDCPAPRTRRPFPKLQQFF